ncbi:phosphoenolpyruvate--protein phosphotransferase PtsP [Enterovibrio norvegicus FF-33]|uniref:phosphoenolpyruvate--protein phosphotransferase n=1 Tax=Enterovibrio TaxID=188143 RepID=UPI0003020DEE|nr:phosphoenolpyruvate--protein phosphotransferase [Enterovibrio norvegicus]OEE69724.1 phosphoenolpyruvate--protein phosphotransferase PtsP [Enterovibrio norvegicus FF-33]
MLTKLRDIVNNVASSSDVKQALNTLVSETCSAMDTECCSVYIADHDRQVYELMATQGLNAKSRRVALSFNEGLIGLVGRRAEPINLAFASGHVDFKHFPDIGEDVFNAFLGTPIIYRRQVLGVLVVQQRDSRQFNESEESFLVTLAAQLAVVFAHAKAQGLWPSDVKGSLLLEGAAASPGVAIAKAWCDVSQPRLDLVSPASCLDNQKERDRLEGALSAAISDFRRLRKRFDNELNQDTLAIFDLFIHLLNDPVLRKAMNEHIQQGDLAEWAVKQTIDSFAERFQNMSDPYLRDRANDVKELGQRLLYFLENQETKQWNLDEPVILFARELTAAMLAAIPRDCLAGVVAEEGAVNAHAAILARALGIPAVMGVEFNPQIIHQKKVVLDGFKGRVLVEPSAHILKEYKRLRDEELELQQEVDSAFTRRTETADGVRVEIHLNAGLSADTSIAINRGVDGVGLYRTEVPFLMQRSFPSEEDQVKQYQSILDCYPKQSVVMRTLDIGGDKPLPYLKIEEDNPFLGWRGIRFTLDHPDIFLIQVRAMLRASIGRDNLAILLPMISGLSELLEAKTLVNRAFNEVSEIAVSQGKKLNKPRLGIMVEVPSVLYQFDAIAPHIDFLSVGTNDLTQYLLAVDRNNARVADVYDTFHPSVLAVLHQILMSSQRLKLPVSVCGEFAGDPIGAALLVGMGYRQLSMNTRSVAKIKYVLRHIPSEALQKHVLAMQQLSLTGEIRKASEDFLERYSLGGLIRVGK